MRVRSRIRHRLWLTTSPLSICGEGTVVVVLSLLAFPVLQRDHRVTAADSWRNFRSQSVQICAILTTGVSSLPAI